MTVQIPEGGNNLVFVGTPIERMLMPDFLQSRARLIQHLMNVGMYGGQGEVPGCRVDTNRNELVKLFLKDPRNPEWLLMLDDDMTYPETLGERLASWRVPVVCPLYFMAGATFDPIVYHKLGTDNDEYDRPVQMWETRRQEVYDFLRKYQVREINGPMAIDDPPPDVLHEVDGCGGGGLMIHRSVLAKLRGPWFEFSRTGGEDFFFCKLVQDKLGYPIYADYSTICGHLRFEPHGAADFLGFMRQRGYLLLRYAIEHAANWMSMYFKMSRQTARDEIESYHPDRINTIWDSVPHETKEDVQAFYKMPEVGRQYITELLRWNMGEYFSMLARYLMPFQNQRVLEIGAGIGSLAMQMAVQECDVFAYEPNETLRDFTAWRWKWYMGDTISERTRAGKIILSDEWPLPEDGTFDLVIATDVFEHVHPDELPEMLKAIGQLVPKRGRLYFHNNWSQQDGLFPYHYDHSEQWERWLEDAGFFLWDPERWAIKIQDINQDKKVD